jgi:hypothetical protein
MAANRAVVRRLTCSSKEVDMHTWREAPMSAKGFVTIKASTVAITFESSIWRVCVCDALRGGFFEGAGVTSGAGDAALYFYVHAYKTLQS